MKIGTLLLAGIPLLAGGLLAQPALGQEEVNTIYRAVIEAYVGASQAVVRTGPGSRHDEEFVRRTMPGLDEGLVRAYVEAVRTGEPSLEGRDLGISIEWLTPERSAALTVPGDPQQYWRNFQAAFPGASRILHLSPVGLSADRREALMSLAQRILPPGSCSAALLHLSWRESGWRIVRQEVHAMC